MLEPKADGFRNYLRAGEKLSPETLLVDRAYMLNLSAPEMTVLIGGMRALNTNFGNSQLRAIAEVYATAHAREKFVRDFVAAWDKFTAVSVPTGARPQKRLADVHWGRPPGRLPTSCAQMNQTYQAKSRRTRWEVPPAPAETCELRG